MDDERRDDKQPDRRPDLIVIESPEAVRGPVRSWQRAGLRVGLVPTMGALHAGHVRLIETARRECGAVVVTIFVNPTQFGPTEDLAKYPRPLEADLAKCRAAGADLVFHPKPEAMYPQGFATKVSVGPLATVLEGAHRPGHFDGVATVVLKLFEICGADAAYFGLKDFQQQLVIRRMARDLNVPIDIRTVPTVRDADGLALSSRNVYLSPEERRSALALSESLNLARERLAAGERNVAAVRAAMREHLTSRPGVTVDYATIADPKTLAELDSPQPAMVALIAARVGSTRLIDNMLIEGRGARGEGREKNAELGTWNPD
jgi:pantoate--beta-alanine ligase